MASSTTYIGWGSTAWGQGSWGTDLIVVSVDGVEATTAVGTVSVVADANVFPTGVEATGATGTVTVSGAATVQPSGLEGTTAVGTVSVVADANIFPAGVEATGEEGDVTVTADANVQPSGLSVTGSVGTVSVVADANIYPTGVNATGAVGTVGIVAEANVYPTGVEAEGEVPSTGPTFTASGNAALSTDQKKFGTASLELDGTGDYVKSASNSAVDGNFTVEFFVYASDFLQDAFLWDTQVSNSGLAISITSLGKLRVVKDNLIVLNVNSTLTDDAWNHIALVGNGNFLTIFVNGSPRGQYLTTGGNSYPNQPYYIGCRHTEADFFSGYIDEFRASKVARYSGLFTPSTTPFDVDKDTSALLHFDGADGSTTITNSAIAIFVALGVVVPVTRVTGTTQLGTVTTSADAIVSPDGVEATGAVGTPLVWGDVDDNQDPEWEDIPVNTSTWADVSTSQTPSWQNIAGAQIPTWGNVSTEQDADWQDIAA